MDKILSDDAQAVSEREALLPSEDKAREAFWGCYPENGNGDMSDVWMMAYRWCRAVLTQQPAAQPTLVRDVDGDNERIAANLYEAITPDGPPWARLESSVAERWRRAVQGLSDLSAQQPAAQAIPAQWVEAVKVAREALGNFQITGPDADGLLWLVLHGNGTSGKAMFQLGLPDRLAGQVALLLEQDRSAALAHLDALTKEQP